MNKKLKIILISAAVLVTAAALVLSGAFISRRLNPDWNGYGRFGNNANPAAPDDSQSFFGRGMMGRAQNYGMLGRFWNNGTGRGYGMGGGMMGGFWNNSAGQSFRMGRGMLGWNFTNADASDEPLSIETAKTAFEDYLADLDNEDLELAEIMVFDQNAYAVVVEKGTGVGAMELLVDPSTLNVFPEYGPNRMWNSKYGMMGNSGFGFSGGCGRARGLNFNSNYEASSQMTLAMDQAADAAAEYLADNISGAELDRTGQPFYGYYTFDYAIDGQTAGMLSVNGSSAQVWLHTWHGQFIEEWELDE